jgi:hypothetical protein
MILCPPLVIRRFAWLIVEVDWWTKEVAVLGEVVEL